MPTRYFFYFIFFFPPRYRLDEAFLKEIRERIEKYKDSELKQPEKKKELNKNLR